MAKSAKKIKGVLVEGLDKVVKEMQEDMARRHSPNFREQERKREEANRRRRFMARAVSVGLDLAVAKFLYETFALIDHEHWDGRIG